MDAGPLHMGNVGLKQGSDGKIDLEHVGSLR
jgi:hypothetical protein